MLTTRRKQQIGNVLNVGKKGLQRLWQEVEPSLKKGCQKAIETGRKFRDTSNSTIDELLDYYSYSGLVGEENLAILQTLCLIHNKCFGIYSESGSGKSFAVEKALELIPENWIYRLELCSKTAVYYDEKVINQARIIYIPELQKAMQTNPLITEMLKTISEGRDATRKVTSIGGAVDTYKIQAGKGIVFTLATENSFMYDAELARRFLIFETDTSQEQTLKILQKKAEARYETEKDYSELKRHIRNCMQPMKFENPFIEEVASQIPPTLLARTYSDHLFDLFEASARFNYKRRDLIEGKIVVDLEDVELIKNIFWDRFIKTLGCEPSEYPLTSFSVHHAKEKSPTSYNL